MSLVSRLNERVKQRRIISSFRLCRETHTIADHISPAKFKHFFDIFFSCLPQRQLRVRMGSSDLKTFITRVCGSLLGSCLMLGMANTAFAQTDERPSVKVGMVTTLTGGGKGLGIDIRDGFQLALRLNDTVDVDLIVEDDARNVDQAVEIVDRFLNRADVDVVTGIVWSNLALTVVPNVVNEGTVYISPNAGPSALAGASCHKYYFNVAWQNDNIHEAMGEFMYTEGYEAPFIIAPDYPAGHDAMRGFKRFYGPVVSEVYTELGASEYGEVIAQIEASDAQTIYFFLPGGMGVNFFKQYKAAGGTKQLFGPAFSFDQTILDVVGDDAIGVLNTSQWVKEIDYPANTIFVDEFFKAYGRYPSLYASQGYDAANLIIKAMEFGADPSDADSLREAMLAVDIDSPRGAIRFDSNQHPIQDFVVRIVERDENGLTNRFFSYAMADRSSAYVGDCALGQ